LVTSSVVARRNSQALAPGLHNEWIDKVRHPPTEGVEADRLEPLVLWSAFVDFQNSIDKQRMRIRSCISCSGEKVLVDNLKEGVDYVIVDLTAASAAVESARRDTHDLVLA
jgi:hypothetical protein